MGNTNGNLRKTISKMMDHQERMECIVEQLKEQNKNFQNTSLADRMKMKIENDNLKSQLRDAEKALSDQEKKQLVKLQAQREATRKKWGIDNVNKFNFAITGNSGVGKSSLLNALMGLDPLSKEAANTDAVECTSKPTPYTNKYFSSFVLWDLPGAGTPAHPKETYYEDNALHAFNAILIVTGDRITETEVEIAKLSHEAQLPIAFVRSKADSSIRDIALGHSDDPIPMEVAANVFEKKVREYFKVVLGKAGLKDIRFFVVSSRAFYPKRTPYKLGQDKSLQGMDEPLLLQFLSEKAGNGLPDSTGELRAMTSEFNKRFRMVGEI